MKHCVIRQSLSYRRCDAVILFLLCLLLMRVCSTLASNTVLCPFTAPYQDSLSSLKHLVSLDLSKNQLTELPHSIGQLSNLKRLSLYGNQLTTLPLEFSLLKQLVFLDLKNNPLEEELAAVAGTCTDEQECTECAKKVRAEQGVEGKEGRGERRGGGGGVWRRGE